MLQGTDITSGTVLQKRCSRICGYNLDKYTNKEFLKIPLRYFDQGF